MKKPPVKVNPIIDATKATAPTIDASKDTAPTIDANKPKEEDKKAEPALPQVQAVKSESIEKKEEL